MATEQQNWKFTISAEVINGDQVYHIHPENFTNLIISYDYLNSIMPTLLAKVYLDKNLLDFIIKNAETLEIYLNIKKFTHAIDDPTDTGAEIDFIKGIYLVSVGSDINYNKELDYVEQTNTELPIEDKFKETYLALISKESVDANKVVANEVIYNTLHQDLVLSYLLQNSHVLLEPFHHNEMHNNLIIPPIDTMSSLIDYLNSVQVFYNTKYILFFDEPKVTYLISRSGTPTLMKGEEHPTVILNMRGTTDNNNLTLGMIDNKDTGNYEVDVSVLDSNYNIDKDTCKILNSIDGIVNPSLENSIISGDIVKNLKSELQGLMKDFLTNTIQEALSHFNVGTKLSVIQNSFQHACDAIQKVSHNLQSRINESVNQFAVTATEAVASQAETVQAACNKILEQLPTTITTGGGPNGGGITKIFMTATQKSIQKSMLDSRFMAVDVSRESQKKMKSDFSKNIDETASEEYKKDFMDNNMSAVTYVNLQDITGKVTNSINSLNNGVIKAIENMQTKINNKIGEFDNFIKKNLDIKDQVQKWKKLVMSAIASMNSGSTSSGGQRVTANSQYGLLLKQIVQQETNLGTIISVADEYGGIAKADVQTGNDVNSALSASKDIFNSYLGSLQSVNEKDVKSQFVSNTPPRIFGNSSLSLDQIIMQSTMGGCFGNSNRSISGLWENMQLGSTLNFSDLTSIANNLMKFDLSSLGQLGLGHVNFDLDLGGIIGTALGSKVGTRLVKIKNDNPNILKNIKSEIELSRNQLSINKFGIDPDVFTPNKEYLIKNYDGHSDKDGKFLLNKKILVFVKEDQRFKCNCQLLFSKAIEN